MQLGKGEAGIGDDGIRPRRRRRRVVAGDLGRAGDAHAVADRDEAEQLAVVDDGHARRRIPGAAREGDGDALHRIDRHADAKLREQRGREASERHDDDVGRDAPGAGRRRPSRLPLRSLDGV